MIQEIKSKFSDESRSHLRSVCGLTDQAIDEIQKLAFSERNLLAYYRKFPTAPKRKEIIDGLLPNVSGLLGGLKDLNPFIERDLTTESYLIRDGSSEEQHVPFSHRRARMLEDLALLERMLRRMRRPAGKAGTKKGDRGLLVSGIALLLNKYGIKPSKRGAKFYDVLEIVYLELNEDTKKIRQDVENCWHIVEGEMFCPDRVHDFP